MSVLWNHPAFRYRACSGALFTSSQCPPATTCGSNEEPGSLNSSCELPFGFLYTPMAVVDNSGGNGSNVQEVGCTAEGLPPILCLTCLAYMNLYATIDRDNPGIWYCPLCGSKNAAPPEALEMQANNPALVSPLLEFRQPLPARNKLKSLATVGPSSYATNLILVLDGNLPVEEAHEIPRVLKHALASTQDIYLGLIIFDQYVSVYQLGLSGMACADVFTAEDGLTDEHLQAREYLTPHDSQNDTSSSMDRLSMCISAAFGVLEGNKENDQGKESSTQSVHGITSSKSLTRLEMLKQRKAERLKKQQQQTAPESALEKQDHTNRIVDFSSKVSPWMKARRRRQENRASSQRHSYRSTGDALHTALNLTAAPTTTGGVPAQTSRVLLFTNGCPNHGDASVIERHDRLGVGPDVVNPLKLARSIEFFDTLARSTPGVAMDVLCTGSSELAIAAYQALVEPSAGYVLPHESYMATTNGVSSDSLPHPLQHNLTFLLQQTYVTSVANTVFSDSQAYSRVDVEGENSTWGGCIVDIRASPFLTPTHLVGPGELVNSSGNNGGDDRVVLPNELSAFASGSSLAGQQHGISTHNLPSRDFVNNTLTRIEVGRVDPLSTYSIMFRTNDSFAQKISDASSGYAFFQCIARFVDPSGTSLVTRVSTHRLSIAKDVGEFLDSVDDEVIPVVLGKEAVYRSMFGREMQQSESMDAPSAMQLESLAFRAQEDLDATISRISGAYRLLGLEQGSRGLDLTEGGGVRAAGSSFDYAFPPELSVALRRLYYLRRGPLLNPGPMRSLDDRAEIRSLFVRFPMEDCLCMMAPLLWSCEPEGASLEEILPETLALWDNSVIAADNYHTIFIWSGRHAADSRHDNLRDLCKSFLLGRSEFRFPMPQLHVVVENDSMSRRFTTLLAPSHGDPVEHSLANFPALSRLSAEELSAVRAKFKFYDPESDPSFRSWFWTVVSATSESKDRGVSLCE